MDCKASCWDNTKPTQTLAHLTLLDVSAKKYAKLERFMCITLYYHIQSSRWTLLEQWTFSFWQYITWTLNILYRTKLLQLTESILAVQDRWLNMCSKQCTLACSSFIHLIAVQVMHMCMHSMYIYIPLPNIDLPMLSALQHTHILSYHTRGNLEASVDVKTRSWLAWVTYIVY